MRYTGFSQSVEFIAGTTGTVRDWFINQGMDDILEGGAGNNVLIGGKSQDCFVFNAQDASTHTIADLETWDILEFVGFGYSNVNDVMSHLHQDGQDVVFNDQGVEVRLIETDLLAFDFRFMIEI